MFSNENMKLKVDLLKQVQATTQKDKDIVRLTNMCEEIVEHANDMQACRPSTRVYALYLKEQMNKFQIVVFYRSKQISKNLVNSMSYTLTLLKRGEISSMRFIFTTTFCNRD